jgi:cytochrome c oxidase subunit 3
MLKYIININHRNNSNNNLLFWDLVTITYAHHSLIQGNRRGALYGGIVTIILAILFTAFQGLEYTVSSFTITDSVYGSCFFFGTGFHGLHVIIGTVFLLVGI